MSLDQETIDAQLDLLATHRRTLAVYLRQQAQLGVLAPPGVANGIAETQSAIRGIKGQLRAGGISVADEPNDDAQPVFSTPSSLSPQEQRNRRAMLAKVKTIWVEGLLEQSLAKELRIALDLTEQLDAVDLPLNAIVQELNRPAHSLPPATSITNVFDRMGGALLILGAPGVGKTTLLLELARDLITRAEQDEAHPIPVVFALSSWASKRKPLEGWLAEELNTKYDVPRKLAQAWIGADLVLPLLDGLDEVAAEQRNNCVEAINLYRHQHGLVPLAVCSRAADYQELATKLRLQGAIVVEPLSNQQIDNYLARAGAKLVGVRAALQADQELSDLLDTPLMLSIATLAYAEKPAAELQAAGTPDQQRRQMFDAYILAMFQRHSKPTNQTQQQTISWLSWLATQMIRHSLTICYIEQLQPDWLSAKKLRYIANVALFSGLFMALASGLAGLLLGLLTALLGLEKGALLKIIVISWSIASVIGGLSGLSIGGLSGYRGTIRPVQTLRWSWGSISGERRSSLTIALLLIFSSILILGLTDALFFGLFFGLFVGLPGWMLGWLAGEIAQADIASQRSAGYRPFHRFIASVISLGTISGAGFWLVGGLYPGLIGILGGGLAGALIFSLIAQDLPTTTVADSSLRAAARIALASGLIGGIICGLLGGPLSTWSSGRTFGSHDGLGFGLIGGLFSGTFGWFGSWLIDKRAASHTGTQNQALYRFARNVFSGGMGGGLITGLLVGLLFGFVGSPNSPLPGGIVSGVVGGMASLLMLGPFFGMISGLLSGIVEGNIATPTVPNEGIRRSARSALIVALGFGLSILLGVGLIFWLALGFLSALTWGAIFGLFLGLIGGLLYGGTTVFQHYTLRWLLYRNGSLPLRLIPFLDYCAERIFLRKVGGGYIFVHRLLMEHFASLYSEQSGKPESL